MPDDAHASQPAPLSDTDRAKLARLRAEERHPGARPHPRGAEQVAWLRKYRQPGETPRETARRVLVQAARCLPDDEVQDAVAAAYAAERDGDE